MDWIRRHWLALLGVLPLLPPIIKWAFWALSRGGDADFIISRLDDPAWVGQLMQWLLNPPEWSLLPMIVIGLLLIYCDVRRNRRGATGDDGVARDARLPDDSQRRELVAAWYKMIDDIDEATAGERGYKRVSAIQNALKRSSHYHRLARYLPEDVQDEVNASNAVVMYPAVTAGNEETPDQTLLRQLRSSIAAIEEEWGLLGPAQSTSSRSSRAPMA